MHCNLFLKSTLSSVCYSNTNSDRNGKGYKEAVLGPSNLTMKELI